LTPNGFFNLQNTSQDFVVLEVDGNTQSELYQKVLLFLHSTYNSPKDVISQVEPVSITINGWSGKAIRRNSMHAFDMGYSINFQFKDNKIRVSAPTFDLTTFTDKTQRLELVANNSFTGSVLGIYNTKGTLKSEHAKNDLETHFNEFIQALNTSLKSSSEDW
jgi:transcription initiation factor IIF auxiliary subunit